MKWFEWEQRISINAQIFPSLWISYDWTATTECCSNGKKCTGEIGRHIVFYLMHLKYLMSCDNFLFFHFILATNKYGHRTRKTIQSFILSFRFIDCVITTYSIIHGACKQQFDSMMLINGMFVCAHDTKWLVTPWSCRALRQYFTYRAAAKATDALNSEQKNTQTMFNIFNKNWLMAMQSPTNATFSRRYLLEFEIKTV